MPPKGFSGNSDLERNLRRVRLGPWLGGIDEKSAPWAIPDGKCADAQNLLLDEMAGYTVKRNGSRKLTTFSTGNAARDGYVFNKTDGGTYLLASDGAELDYTTDAANQSGWHKLIDGLNSDGFMEFETAEDKVWMSNGVDPVMSWDGTTLFIYDREKTVTIDNSTIGTTTVKNTQLTEANDYWKGQKLVFTTGANIGTVVTVTGFVNSTNTITFTPAISGGATTDRFKVGLIIPMGRSLRVYDSRLWIGSDSTNPAELRFSQLTDPNTGADITRSKSVV